MGMNSGREALATATRVVVKVGSSSLTDGAGHLDVTRLDALVDALAERIGAGSEVVLVSSGAQAAGLGPMGLDAKPKDLAMAQAAASVGQGLLIAHYTEAFARHNLTGAQVLLTPQDIIRRSHYRNAHRTLTTLLRLGITPIINENDSVATDEIRFGDNDRLAALVAYVVKADALVLLTDVDGLYDRPPNEAGAQLIDTVTSAEQIAHITIAGTGSKVGTGGMATKIAAATLAASAGIPALLAPAEKADAALRAEPGVGTFFAITGRRMSAHQLWLGYAAQSEGRVLIDAGAVRAIMEGKKSLLPVGVTAVEGEFHAGDVIEIADGEGHAVARGMSGYSSTRLAAVAGKSLHDIADELGPNKAHEVVHRDELVTHAAARRPGGAAE